MAVEFTLPDVGEGVAEGEIVQWLVEPGDAVVEDQPLVEVETDKAVVEVPSPVDGTVAELRAEAGEVVPVGEVIVVLQPDAEGDAEPTTVEPEPVDSGGGSGADAEPDETPGEAATADGEASSGRVFASPSARRVARELGVDITTVEGSGPAGRVSEQDVRAAAEAADEGPEGTPGTEAAPDDGETAGAESGAGGTETAGAESPPAAPDTDGRRGATPGGDAADRDRTLAVPATRRLAEEMGVDLDRVPATEERDGQPVVTPEAVREYADAQRAAQVADADAVAGEGATAESVDGEREDERVPYRGVRRTIGERMERSAYTAPHVTHHDRVDVTALVDARDDLADRAADRGVSLSYLPFVMKAVVAALREYPILNSQLDEEREEIVKRGAYNIGVATATDAGLMVPVVDDVDRKSILRIAAETNELVEKARERSIGREEMQGGTFTITNFGAIGGEYATPIINYPETAILGLGAVRERPWVVDDGATEPSRTAGGDAASRVEPRHVLPLSLSIDHRVIDGAEAARFTNRLMEYLHDPTLLLLE